MPKQNNIQALVQNSMADPYILAYHQGHLLALFWCCCLERFPLLVSMPCVLEHGRSLEIDSESTATILDATLPLNLTSLESWLQL